MKTIFFGTPRFAQIVLEKLVNSPFKPQLVVTAPDTKVGRGQKFAPSHVKQTALKHKITVSQPINLTDPNWKLERPRSLSRSGNWKFDIAILVAYGRIIPKEILAISKYGFVNVHPSILPKYRGPSPIQSAITSGDKKTGITIMLLDEKIDHGPILAQKEIKIEDTDTHASLIEKLGLLGANLLIEILPQYTTHLRGVKALRYNSGQTHLGGGIRPQYIFHLRGEKTLNLEGVLRQDHSKATFTKIIKKSDGYIDLPHPPNPQTLDRMIRAFYPWPGVWCKLKIKNEKLKIIKFLPGNLILLEGKRPMTVSEFKNGYPQLYEQIKHILPLLH